RPLIRAMVEVMQPAFGATIHDPAAGTGGFLLAAFEYLTAANPDLNRDERHRLRHHLLSGVELVDNTARLAVMNLYLHNIGTDSDTTPIRVGDSLRADTGERFDMVLTNPPFGKKSSFTVE